MTLTTAEIRAYIRADLSGRFGQPPSAFKDDDNLRTKWMFSDKSLREWGKKLRMKAWYKGWFAPSQIMACVKIIDVITLMHDTQNQKKPKESKKQWNAMVKAGGANA